MSLAKSFISGFIGDADAILNIRRIDEGGIDGDLCAVVSSPNLTVVCVVWPTAAKLKQLKKLSEVSPGTPGPGCLSNRCLLVWVFIYHAQCRGCCRYVQQIELAQGIMPWVPRCSDGAQDKRI